MGNDAIYKGYWHYDYEKNGIANAYGETKETAKKAAAEFEKPPKDTTKCLLLESLQLGR
jgi:hypothetical protein